VDSRGTRIWLVALGALVVVASVLALGAQTWAQQEEERRITVDLREAKIFDALSIIFRDTPYSFSLEPGITGTITLSLQEVPFSTALRAILNSNTPKLTYRKEPGDIYVITQLVEPTTPTPQPEITEPAAEQQVYWIGPGGRYELQYLDCRDVAAWFGGYVVSGTPMIPMAIGGAGGGGAGFGGAGAGGGGAGGGGAGGGGAGGGGSGSGGGGSGGGGSGGGGSGGGGSGGGGGGSGGGGSGGGGSGGGGSGGGGRGGGGGGRGRG